MQIMAPVVRLKLWLDGRNGMSPMRTRIPQTCIIAFPVLLMGSQSACSERSPDSKAAAQHNVQSAVGGQHQIRAKKQPNAGKTALPAETALKTAAEIHRCRFEVDGRVLVDGECDVFPMGNGRYTLNTWKRGKPTNSHFAVEISNDGKTAEASWRADQDDDQAADSLSSVRLRSGCWVNRRTEFCSC